MAQLVLLALTALAAVAGYREAATLTRDRRGGFAGVPPLGCAIACGFVGLIGAIFVPAIILAALSGIVAYHSARKLEEQWREAPFGIAVPVWVVGCTAFGFGGAALTSTALWLVVSAFLALVGALLLAVEERNILVDEKRALLAENRRLRSDKSPSGSNALASSSSISPRSFRIVQQQQELDGGEAQSHASARPRPNLSNGQKAYLFGDPPSQQNVTRSVSIPSTRHQGSTPIRAGNGTDLLPHRSRRLGLWSRLVDPRTFLGSRDDEIRARIERVAAEVVAESPA